MSMNGSRKLTASSSEAHAIFDLMSERRDSAGKMDGAGDRPAPPEPVKAEDGGSSVLETARSLSPRVFAFGGIAVWCFLLMVISLNLAVTSLHWLSIAVFGVLLPLALITYAHGLISPHELPSPPRPEDKENELLEVLGKRGELTPTLAAMKTSLTVSEASAMLEELSRKGYLEMRGEDGILAYSLWERDFRESRSEARSEPKSSIERTSAGRVENDAPVEWMNESLSERELEVLTLLASGKSNREIAKDLFVALGTVKTHTNNIYRKLGAKNRAEALAKARALQLI